MKVFVLLDRDEHVIGTFRPFAFHSEGRPIAGCAPMEGQTLRSIDVTPEVFGIEDGAEFHKTIESLLRLGARP